MKTTNHNVTATAADAIRQWVSGTIKAEQGQTKAVDALYADGVQPSDLESPEKGADRTAYDSYRFAIVAGFPAEARKMVEADKVVAKGFPKVDEDEAKENRLFKCDKNRRYWQQQIGSKLKDLRNALTKRYTAAEQASMSEEERAAQAAEAAASATDSARLLRDVTAWINRLEKAEATELPVVDCLKHLKALAAIATASMPA